MRDRRLTAILVAALVVVLTGGATAAYLVGRDRSNVASDPSMTTPLAVSTNPTDSTERAVSEPTPPEPTSPDPVSPDSVSPDPASTGPGTPGPGSTRPSTPATRESSTGAPSTDPVPFSAPADPPTSSDPTRTPATETESTEVAIAGVAADDPQADEIRDLLQRHFDSINNRDYAGWVSTVTPDLSSELPRMQWLKVYSTTRDTDVSVIRIYRDPRQVDITFRSRQDEKYSPEGKYSCLNWKITHPLTNGADGLRIERSIESDADWRPCSTG